MPVVRVETYIQAPIERCFDLARCVDLHSDPPVAGVTSGLLELNDTVSSEAIHFGTKQALTSKISEMERPYRFVDVLIRGRFKKLHHTHTFTREKQGTLMIDELDFCSPGGGLARLVDALVLKSYMRRVLLKRCTMLKQMAESSEAEDFLKAKSQKVVTS